MPSKRITYLLLLLIFCVNCISWNEKPFFSNKVKWVVLNGGTLRVNGSTNINTFSCIVANNAPSDTLTLSLNKDGSELMTGNINLDLFGFDCHNPMMTLDLRKTLKAKDYPVMKINFLSLEKNPCLKTTQEAIKGWVNIELAGVIKKYEVDYKLSMDNMHVIHLIGDRSVNFSDFNLTPPRKLGGMIKANNNLDVEFSLNIREVK